MTEKLKPCPNSNGCGYCAEHGCPRAADALALISDDVVAYMWTDPTHQRPPELHWHYDMGPPYEGWIATPLSSTPDRWNEAIEAAVKVAEDLGADRIERNADGSLRSYDMDSKHGRGDAVLNAMRVRAQTIAQGIYALKQTEGER